MELIQTKYGSLYVAKKESIFKAHLSKLNVRGDRKTPFTVGLTGGSTPKEFYQYVSDNNLLTEDVLDYAIWSTSDERLVYLESEESNFGNADRLMLEPSGVRDANKFAWPVQVDPHSAPVVFERKWVEKFGHGEAFDLCFLGMGDDGHTASLFPESPVLAFEGGEFFCSVEVPGKGWRLTITPSGLKSCNEVVITVTGGNKAEMLSKVMHGPEDRYPVQILKDISDRVTWYVDPEAADNLQF